VRRLVRSYRCWPTRHAPPNRRTSARCWPAWAAGARSDAAILEGADPKLKVQAVLVLAETNHPEVAIDLLRPSLLEKSSAEVRAAAAAALKQLTGHTATRPERFGS